MRKLRLSPTRRYEVEYWTASDDRDGTCCPTGRTSVYYSEEVSGNKAVERIHNLKRFKRMDGSSRIYDVSEY